MNNEDDILYPKAEKDCPFCGCEAEQVGTQFDDHMKYGYAYCYHCGSSSEAVHTNYECSDTADWRYEAIKLWDTRA